MRRRAKTFVKRPIGHRPRTGFFGLNGEKGGGIVLVVIFGLDPGGRTGHIGYSRLVHHAAITPNAISIAAMDKGSRAPIKSSAGSAACSAGLQASVDIKAEA